MHINGWKPHTAPNLYPLQELFNLGYDMGDGGGKREGKDRPKTTESELKDLSDLVVSPWGTLFILSQVRGE